MAFKLNITACMKDCCSSLQITDVSGILNRLPNALTDSFLTGWDSTGVTNPNPALCTTATIDVTYYTSITDTGTDIGSDNVLSQLIDTTTTGFNAATGWMYLVYDVITPASGSKFVDGLYEITYTITTATGVVYSVSISTFVFCNVKCCVDTMWAQLSSKTGCDYDLWLDECRKAEELLLVLKSSANCTTSIGDTAYFYNTLTALQSICNFTQCNCS